MKQKFSEITLRNYLNVVENSEILIPFTKPKQNENELINKLAKCKIVAQKEFIICHNEIVDIFNNIIKIEKNINQDIEKIKNKFSTHNDIGEKIFDEFNFRLSEIFNFAGDKLIGSFQDKVERIDNFTICLFGRTKVGKSTTMEALTKGKGVSIGIGKQNTTLEIKEYSWNNLKVIDTPGIDAMQKSDQLENLAVSFADKSDLIAFLMPHQIEEGDFNKFRLFYKQNKPIIIILNIKEKIGKEGSRAMKMFIKNSDKIFEKTNDYEDRINDFIFNALKIKKGLVPIIPIHSNSAFISNNVKDKDLSEKLYKISNFEKFENALIKEVTNYGELYRIKNPHETVKLFSHKIKKELENFSNYLSEQQNVLHKNIIKFSQVKNKIEQSQFLIIQKKFNNFFDNKVRQTSSIIDEIFNTKKEEERELILSNFMNEIEIKNKVEQLSIEIQKIIKKEIQDYFQNFSQDINSLDLKYKNSNFNYSTGQKINKIDTNNLELYLIEEVGFATGVIGSISFALVAMEGAFVGATGTIFGVGTANIWNPIGWALIFASVGAGFVTLFFREKQKNKIAIAKKEAKKQLISSINQAKYDIYEKFKITLSEITTKIKKEHIDVFSEYILFSKKYQQKIDDLSNQIEQIAINSDKIKYQAMLNNILNSEIFVIKEIFQTNNYISIFINKLPNNITEIETIFSRVEEKQIIFLTNELFNKRTYA